MQFMKLDQKQREIAAWRRKRNSMVSELLKANPKMLSYEALAEANRLMSSRQKTAPTPKPQNARGMLTCRPCGRKRSVGELFCACSSPWVKLRSHDPIPAVASKLTS